MPIKGYAVQPVPYRYHSITGLTLQMAADPNKPRVLLMGARRSGKSSIQKVVFHKMSPHETLFLEVRLIVYSL